MTTAFFKWKKQLKQYSTSNIISINSSS